MNTRRFPRTVREAFPDRFDWADPLVREAVLHGTCRCIRTDNSLHARLARCARRIWKELSK